MEQLLFALIGPLLVLASLQARHTLARALPFALAGWMAGVAALYLQNEVLNADLALRVLVLTGACVACVWFGKWSAKESQ